MKTLIYTVLLGLLTCVTAQEEPTSNPLRSSNSLLAWVQLSPNSNTTSSSAWILSIFKVNPQVQPLLLRVIEATAQEVPLRDSKLETPGLEVIKSIVQQTNGTKLSPNFHLKFLPNSDPLAFVWTGDSMKPNVLHATSIPLNVTFTWHEIVSFGRLDSWDIDWNRGLLFAAANNMIGLIKLNDTKAGCDTQDDNFLPHPFADTQILVDAVNETLWLLATETRKLYQISYRVEDVGNWADSTDIYESQGFVSSGVMTQGIQLYADTVFTFTTEEGSQKRLWSSKETSSVDIDAPGGKLYVVAEVESLKNCDLCPKGVCMPFGLCVKTDGGCNRTEDPYQDLLHLQVEYSKGGQIQPLQLIPEGSLLNITCKRESGTKPLGTVELVRDNKVVGEKDGILLKHSEELETLWVIPFLTAAQKGSYICRRQAKDELPSPLFTINVELNSNQKQIQLLLSKSNNSIIDDGSSEWQTSDAFAADESGKCEIFKTTFQLKCSENGVDSAPIFLPETSGFRQAKTFSMRKNGDLVFWCHSGEGYLWLTNLRTRITSQVRRLSGCEQLNIDWKHWVAVYLSPKQHVSSLQLNDSAPARTRSEEVEIDSIAIDPENHRIYWLTSKGNVKDYKYDLSSGSERVNGAEQLQKVGEYIQRRGLFFENGLGWITEYFSGEITYIDTLFNSTHVNRFKATSAVRRVYIKQQVIDNETCAQCDQVCEPYLLEQKCKCLWGLAPAQNDTDQSKCETKMVHVLARENTAVSIFSFKLGKEQNFTTSPIQDHVPAVLTSAEMDPGMWCYLTEVGDRHCEKPEGRRKLMKQVPEKSKLLGAFEDGSQFHVVYYQDSCIRVLSTSNSGIEEQRPPLERKLFCSLIISKENHIVDFTNWIVFWQNTKLVDVFRTDVVTRVDRPIIGQALLQTGSTAAGGVTMAIDSKNRNLYWIQGTKLRSVGYEETAVDDPLVEVSDSSRNLMYSDGYLYWIESVDRKDRIVLFDFALKATWVVYTSSGPELQMFTVQTQDGVIRGNSSLVESPSLEDPICTLNSHDERICWCHEERPLMMKNTSSDTEFTCQKPKIFVALTSKDGPKGNYVVELPTFNITATVKQGSPVFFTDSPSQQCWLADDSEEDEATRMKCNSSANTPTDFGIAHKNPTISLNFEGTQLLHNSVNASDGMFNLTKIKDGAAEHLELNPIRMQPGVRVAIDHRRKLVIWCDNIDKRIILKPFNGESTDIRDPKFENEADRCVYDGGRDGGRRISKTDCTSIAIDEAHGIAYFIHGNQIKSLDYTRLSTASVEPEIGNVHQISGYLNFHGLQYYYGYLFWVGGYAAPGQFVESVKIVSQGTSTPIKVYTAPEKSQILQIQVHREVPENTTKSACETSTSCPFFCMPADNWWTLQGEPVCYCPTGSKHMDSCSHLKGAPIPTSAETPSGAPQPQESSEWILYVCIAGGVVFAIFATAVTVICVVYSRKGGPQTYEEAVTLFVEGNADAATNAKDEAEKSYYMPFQQKIDPEDLRINADRQLGAGNFGAVFLGVYKDLEVAIKVVKAGAPQEQLVEFLKELKIMAYIGDHANIVSFFGAEISQLKKGAVLVVLELSPYGDLETYLRKNKKNYVNASVAKPSTSNQYESGHVITFDRLTSWSHQVAQGMAYLEEKQVVHGDLASRNVLLFEGDVAKVSDFGFSRKTYGQQYTKENKYTPLPYRWAAPETLEQMVFSAQTDVWSYGVTVWEIFTLGNCPFVHEVWDITFAIRLREGMRLDKPEHATDEIYDRLMHWCWQSEPEDRPTFQQLCRVWEDMLGVGGSAQAAQLTAQFGTLPSVKPVPKAVQNAYAVRNDEEIQDMSKFFKDGLELNFTRNRP